METSYGQVKLTSFGFLPAYPSDLEHQHLIAYLRCWAYLMLPLVRVGQYPVVQGSQADLSCLLFGLR